MDSLTDIIKKDKDHIHIMDGNENYPSFQLSVKIEKSPPHLDAVDWCIENDSLFNIIDKEIAEPSSFDELMEYREQKCSFCYTFYNNSYALIKHKLIHLKVSLQKLELYQCDECSSFHTTKDKLTNHIKKAHQQLTKLKINNKFSIGQQKFLKTKSLHQCNICDKILTYRRWHSHMTEMHVERKYRCLDCDIKFKTARNLQRHLMYSSKHEGLIPSWRRYKAHDLNITCDKCQTVLKNKDCYRQHMYNVHSGEVHTCTICKSTLKSKSYLLAHIRKVHYDDGQKHICKICGKEYKSPLYLSIHLKNTHLK